MMRIFDPRHAVEVRIGDVEDREILEKARGKFAKVRSRFRAG